MYTTDIYAFIYFERNKGGIYQRLMKRFSAGGGERWDGVTFMGETSLSISLHMVLNFQPFKCFMYENRIIYQMYLKYI
jgi:hypothetical protein